MKKQTLSIALSVLLTQSIFLVGCGSNGGSDTVNPNNGAEDSTIAGSSSSNSKMVEAEEASSSSAGSQPASAPMSIHVFSPYPVVDATVIAENTTALTVGAGQYEFSRSVSANAIVVKGGVIDLNENGKADHGEPMSPQFEADGSLRVVNPFTTMVQNGMTPEEIVALYPSVASYAPTFEGIKDAHETLKDSFVATVRLAIKQFDTKKILNVDAVIEALNRAVTSADAKLVYQKAMYEIGMLYTDEDKCLPLAPCVYEGITPKLDVDYSYSKTDTGSSSEANDAPESSASSSSYSSRPYVGGETTPVDPE